MILKPSKFAQLNYQHPLAKGLVHCWLGHRWTSIFTRDSCPIQDANVRRNLGYLVGNTSFVAGKFGSSLIFDGTGDYVRAVYPPRLSGFPFTLCAWAHADGEPGNGTGTAISISDFSEAIANFRIGYYNNASYGWRFLAGNEQIKVGQLSTGWQHLVAVAVSSTLRYFYVNGKLIGSQSTSVGWPSGMDKVTLGVVGRSSAYTTDLLNGGVDNAKIYNRALSASEISELYRNPFCMFEREPLELWVGASPSAGGIDYVKVINNSLGIVDVDSKILVLVRIIAESLGISDVKIKDEIKVIIDSIGIVDLGATMDRSAVLQEQLGIVDSIAQEYAEVIDDNVGIVDSISTEDLARAVLAFMIIRQTHN